MKRLLALIKKLLYYLITKLEEKEMPRGRPKLTEEEKLVRLQAREQEKAQVVEQPKAEVAVTAKVVELNHVAYGLEKDKKTGRYHIVKIKYDFETGTVGSVEKVGEGDDRSIAIERFKIELAKSFMS